MEILVVVLILAALAVTWLALTIRRWGGFRAAFSRDLADDRAELVKARGRVASLKRQRRLEQASSAKGAKKVRRRYDAGVKDAEKRLQSVADPGTGKKLYALEDACLYEHTLTIGKTSFPLSKILWVSARRGGLRLQTVDQRLHDFDCSKTADNWLAKLAVEAHNAILSEREWRQAQPGLIDEAERALAAAKRDTAAVEEADGLVMQTRTTSSIELSLVAAREELANLEKRWSRTRQPR